MRCLDKKTERPKDKKTKRQKDRKTKRQKDRKTKRQKDKKTKRLGLSASRRCPLTCIEKFGTENICSSKKEKQISLWWVGVFCEHAFEKRKLLVLTGGSVGAQTRLGYF